MIYRRTSSSAGVLLALAIAVAASAPARAQTHKVAKPEDVIRAVGVYEWTGDMARPAASRLIPVSLFIDNKLEDAAVYLARPVPLALLTGNVYELDNAGVPKGTLDILLSRHFEPTGLLATTYDDGWFGYGKFVPPAPPRKMTAERPARTVGILSDEDDDKPHFSAKSAVPGSGGAANPAPGTSASTDAPADDPDRPTLHRSSSASDQTASNAGDAPAADPDRPTTHRASDSSGTSDTSSQSGSASADDADRPTLRRRSPAEAKKARDANQASVTDVGNSLNDDPNRPTLHRGKPEGSLGDADLPKLNGLPGDQDLHQMVAVSDPVNRPVHDFAREWADEAEHQAILAKMQAAARAQLKVYEATNAGKPATPPPAAAKTAASARTAAARRKAAAAPVAPPPPEPLLDEQLKAYTLSYGGAATYVYTAHTDGLGPTLRYVTIVAQVNMQGEPEVAFKSATDAEHLDRTPRYRLVDVVDAEASNRASLLFELREQNSRQFALYRVIGARADQTFLTGTTE